MATKTTPEHFVQWATGGGADKAAPIAGRFAQGWNSSTKADFNSDLNYILNNLCAWSEFNAKVNACEIAKKNTDYTGVAAPWAGEDASAYATKIRYDARADRWYASMSETLSSANHWVYDSADGITWSAAKQIHGSSDSYGLTCNPVYSNGTKCAAVTSANWSTTATPSFWLSTDNTVANLVETATTIGSLDKVYDFLWDPDSSRWFACGSDAADVNGYIYSSSDGTSWTLEHNSAGPIVGMATDGSGNGFAVKSTTDTVIVTGGLTSIWTLRAASAPAAARGVTYLPSLDAYIVYLTTSGSVYFVKDPTTGTFVDSDYDFDAMLFSDEVALFEGDTGTRSSDFVWYALHNVYDNANSVVVEDMGKSHLHAINNLVLDNWFEGGAGKIVWAYDVGGNDYLAVTYYGAPDGGTA